MVISLRIHKYHSNKSIHSSNHPTGKTSTPLGHSSGKANPAAVFFGCSEVYHPHYSSKHPTGKTRSPAVFNKGMGRSKQYRSPSTAKRNLRRLVLHLHKMLKSIKTQSEKLLDNSIDTISNSEKSEDKFETRSFVTSTPKRVKISCDECWNACAKKHPLEIHWPPDRLH